MDESLQQFFYEAFFSRTLWQATTEIRYFASFEFGDVDLLVPSLVCIVAATLAGFANSLVGRLLAVFQAKGEFNLPEERYEAAQVWGNLLIWVVGVLSWYWLGAVFLAAAGFLRVPHWKVTLATLIGQVGFYGYYYLVSIGQLAPLP
ncbi:MAG: hypothetical protein FJX23_05620 [Alphaproteobacteria bacterium]|nr:hypothetical protein [Alphaproteobacteria bacterium]